METQWNFEDALQELFAQACNEVLLASPPANACQEDAARFDFLFEDEGVLTLTPEQRKQLQDYFHTSSQPDLEPYISCYSRGLRDGIALLNQIGLF
ncbi:hypothetical protein H8699_08955 [Christensenellaceae bacterium NSJ-44]|jgi:hypothetical protein|uniref:Uncharacterized protein n=1 Tax=Luoshenia tenuis TaxID=2763654 RepID=A0A926D0Y6_9FIRM|nr:MULTISPECIES: hypothetical protein [Clostridia]MBC8529552.1 hypothetical protein [Luoshenia tenuis]SCI75687.1 Uncharacterised protein [uncultured Clostridium sp.]